MKNAGKYNKRITICKPDTEHDSDDFLKVNDPKTFTVVLKTWASVKTTRGMTVIASGSDFEKVYTNFTIRFPKKTRITREMRVLYGDNNIDEADDELELQCYEVSQ